MEADGDPHRSSGGGPPEQAGRPGDDFGRPLAPDPGAPGSRAVRRTVATSARHRVVTRLRLLRMAPRRRRYLADLRQGRGPWGRRSTAAPVGAGAADPPRVLVVAHVYYPELWSEIADRIALVPGEVDVVVTLVRDRAAGLAAGIRERWPGADVRVVENRGRDWWPLVQVLDRVAGHDAVLKLHTKRTPHLPWGEAWRGDLLDGVCGSTEQVDQILRLLVSDPRVGIVAPPRNVLGREFVGNNAGGLSGLVRRSGVAYRPAELWFPAGSMFWARPEVVLALADLDLTAEEFGVESGAIDGTAAHALERYLGVVAAARGLAVVESSEVDGLLALAASA